MTVIDRTNHDALCEWIGMARDVGTRFASGVAERDLDGAICQAAFDQIRQTGLSAALVPTEYGGGGATHREAGAILHELSRHVPAVAVTLSMHTHLVATQLWRHRHGMDASPLFEKVVDGSILVSTGASDWVGATGSALRVDGGWRITTRKSPASGCELGDILVTSVQTTDGSEVIHCSIPMQADGVSIDHTWDTLGMRSTGSHTVVVDDVFVPDGAVALVRPSDRWHPIWNTVLGSALPLIMISYLGIADRAVEVALDGVDGRSAPHLPQVVGEMITAHTAATDTIDAMFAAANDLDFDNTDEGSARMLARKSTAAEALIATVRLAVEAVGGRAYSKGHPLERMYRDIHGCMFHPLPRSRQARFTGMVSLGMEPDVG